MSVAAKTADDLVRAVRLKAMRPVADGTFPTTDVLALADDVQITIIASLLQSTRSGRWAATSDVALSDGVAAYTLPPDALAGGLHDLTVVTAEGVERDLAEVATGGRPYLPTGDSSGGAPTAYVWEHDQVVLSPTPQGVSGHLLRFRYPTRPRRLVSPTGNRVADALATVAPPWPSEWSSSTETVDVISGSSGRVLASTDVEDVGGDVAYPGGASQIASLEADGAKEGDYLALPGETPVPWIPESVFPLLVAGTVVELLEALGDQSHLTVAQARYDRLWSKTLSVLAPRNRGERRRIVPRHSPLRSAGRRRHGQW